MTEQDLKYGEEIHLTGGNYTILLPNGDSVRLVAMTGTLIVEKGGWEKSLDT